MGERWQTQRSHKSTFQQHGAYCAVLFKISQEAEDSIVSPNIEQRGATDSKPDESSPFRKIPASSFLQAQSDPTISPDEQPPHEGTDSIPDERLLFRRISILQATLKARRSPSLPGSHPNIIVFGQTGAGKSSLINMIAGKEVSQTASDLTRCTFDSQPYDVEIDESLTVTLWDTAGLNQGSRRDNDTIMRICELIIRLEKSAILLIFCSRHRLHTNTLENYQMIRAICDATVPMAVVISGLEKEPDRAAWWSRNELKFRRAGMLFNDHACVVGIRGQRIGNSNRFAYGEAYDASVIEVKALIKRAYLSKPRNQGLPTMLLENTRTPLPDSASDTSAQLSQPLNQKLKKLGLSKKDREYIVKAYMQAGPGSALGGA